MDKLESMQVYMCVVDTHSFARAAEALGLPRSTVSRVIKTLEAYLGIQLLQRTTRKLSVTPDGRHYYAECKRLLAEIDQVALYRYRAEQIRQTSDALRQGRVMLRQGRWHANRTVTTCEGQTVKPDLDTLALAHIERRQNHSSVEVSVAWLEAPEGSQLLLVANEDFCTWQPTEKSF